jgi:hypothetical protein
MSDPRSFRLSSSFLEQFEGRQPEWGPLGYTTFKRTYSRPLPDGGTEEFWQTCKRVVEGCYNIQKSHCHGLKLPWDNAKAQKSAQEMFQRMWDFKFLPPGRGLWMMGTDYVLERGSSCLFNCGFHSTVDIKYDLAEPFCWLMDMLMLGVGVGFDTRGAGTFTVKRPRTTDIPFVIQDSREGWVSALRSVLSPFAGVGALPTQFDYSMVRPLGSPIAGFGGTASGPEPLRELLEGTIRVLSALEDAPITSTAIVDICNYVGRCVVAGNTRRSALIAFGEPSDTDFMDLKNPEVWDSSTLEFSRWASNNSIFAEIGMDYTDAAARTAINGEPGYEWLHNGREFSRMKDPPDGKDRAAMGTNPCQPGFATVLTPAGIRTFDDIDVGSTVWSGKQWTTVVAKACTGTKPVSRYVTRAGVFTGTDNHQVFQRGERALVRDAEVIDVSTCTDAEFCIQQLSPDDVMRGLLLGDGTVHKASSNLVLLCVGKNDQCYFSSEVSHLIGDHRPGVSSGAYEVRCDVSPEVLVKLPGRSMPAAWLRLPPVQLAGVLRGLYSANGSVVSTRITLKSSCLELVEQVQQALSSLGIASYYTINKAHEVEFASGTYECKQSYDLNIGTFLGRERFSRLIGFLHPYKTEKLARTLEKDPGVNKGKGSYAVVAVEELGDHPVYDITVAADEHSYWTGGLLVSNCGEILLQSAEHCNLVETFPSRHETYEDFRRTLKFAYLYAKSVTLLPTHSAKTNQVILKNRRIGASMSGIVQAMQKHGKREFFSWCDNGYQYLKELDKTYSDWLCIRESIKLTSVKPSGSVSLLPGVTPGIHYPHSEYYIRRIRFQEGSALLGTLQQAGYPVERDVYSPNTMVVSFPAHEQLFDRSKVDVTMWEQLELAAQMQYYWADNQVSVTVTFMPHEAKDIKHALELYETRLKSVSFLPNKDHGYKQAPYEETTKEQYEALVAGIDQTAIFGAEATHDQIDKFCDGEVCLVK